jgi:hypothetical protein
MRACGATFKGEWLMKYVRVCNRFTAAAIAGSVLVGLSALPSKAGYVVNLTEVGGNVVATGSGPINSNELSGSFPSVGIDEIIPSVGVILIGEPVADEFLIPATGPGSFGPGGPTIADSASGDIVGISGGAAAVIVPLGYVSAVPCRAPRPGMIPPSAS